MNHDAYERQMIDAVNRNAEEKKFETATEKVAEAGKHPLVDTNDSQILKRGLKRMALAITTVMFFAAAIVGLIAVAKAPGYLAVILFLASLVELEIAFTFLYAQGLTRRVRQESQGESK